MTRTVIVTPSGRRTLRGFTFFALAVASLHAQQAAKPAEAATMAAPTDIKSALNAAEAALGSKDLNSIEYTATGFSSNIGQSYNPSSPWPKFDVTSYTRTINYARRASKEEMTRIQGYNQAKGGGAPIMGEQRQNQQVNGNAAWNVTGAGPVAQFGATAEERQLQIWLTPAGFIKAARLGNGCAIHWDCEAKLISKTEGGKKVNVISAVLAGKFPAEATLDDKNLIAKIETKIPSPVLGDMAVVTTFSGYKDYNGVKFPSKITQTQGGFMASDLNIKDAKPNAPAEIAVPDAVKDAEVPSPRVDVQLLSDGVWYLTGGTHHSLVVEFKDYMAIIEAPLNEERSNAILTEARHLVINKPLKYVINTHHHFDHSGGLRTMVAEGATIVTSAINKPYYDKAFAAKATVEPDKLSKSPKAPSYVLISDKYLLTDGTQKIEIYPMKDEMHNEGMLLVYLPSGKVLVEADEWNPPASGDIQPPAGTTPAPAVALYDNIQRLKLDVSKIAPIHGRLVTMADFLKYLGKSKT